MNHQNNPLVSVIVPVYNVEQYLDECLNSIRQQTYENLEIIVIEDCSTDNSLNTLIKHLEDSRVKLIQHEKNSGLSAARNTGIDAAQGKYIAFVDSDDLVHSDYIKTCIIHITEKKTDLVLISFCAFNDGKKINFSESIDMGGEAKILNEDQYLNDHNFAWLKFFNTKILKESNLKFPVGFYYEDWPFHWQIIFNDFSILKLDIPFYFYRLRSGSITSSGDHKLIHIFLSHRIIFENIEKYEISNNAKKILARKIHGSFWTVLTQIDVKYLNQAISEAKTQLHLLGGFLKKYEPKLKSRIIIFLLGFNEEVTLKLIIYLRRSLKLLSSFRRNRQNMHHSK